MMQALEPWCCAFLYTNIDTEGLMQGIPLNAIQPLRQATAKQLIAAGGICTTQQIDELHAIGVDSVVGMAIYTGKIDLASARLSPNLNRG
jgi:phosphoribosylformimino-5-aminoimidazole carboxamide ribonucleotide (ProFAR) isomerase